MLAVTTRFSDQLHHAAPCMHVFCFLPHHGRGIPPCRNRVLPCCGENSFPPASSSLLCPSRKATGRTDFCRARQEKDPPLPAARPVFETARRAFLLPPPRPQRAKALLPARRTCDRPVSTTTPRPPARSSSTRPAAASVPPRAPAAALLCSAVPFAVPCIPSVPVFRLFRLHIFAAESGQVSPTAEKHSVRQILGTPEALPPVARAFLMYRHEIPLSRTKGVRASHRPFCRVFPTCEPPPAAGDPEHADRTPLPASSALSPHVPPAFPPRSSMPATHQNSRPSPKARAFCHSAGAFRTGVPQLQAGVPPEAR